MRGSSISGFRVSCLVAVGVEVAEWLFSQEKLWTDLFGGVGVELVKAGIASAIGFAAAVTIGTMTTFAAAPVIIGAAVVFGVGWGLNALDNHYGIKNSVKTGLRYAVSNLQYLPQKAVSINLDKLRDAVEKKAVDVLGDVADALYDEARVWVLRKLKSDGYSRPGWPQPPQLPNFPNLKYLKL